MEAVARMCHGAPTPSEGRDSLPTPATGFPGFLQQRRKPRVIAGDIWACLKYQIEDLLPQDREREALGYVEQAAEFYEAAENPQIRSRPLLYYYSFLNVTKALLIARGVRLPPRTRHGVYDPKANQRARLRFEGQKVRIVGATANREEVLPELIREPGGGVTGREYKVVDLLGQVPAIHRTYLGVAPRGAQPKFMPARFDVLYDGGEVWARMILNRRAMDVKRTLKDVSTRQAFKSTFHPTASPKGEIWFETDPEPGARRGIDPALVRLGERIRACGLWSVLTSRGYLYYLSSHTPAQRLPQLASAYAVMFYLGSITRYKPYDYDRIVSGRYAWLVNEFVATQPRQFLYLVASLLAEVDVVRPYALT
jgi:YaaC-like Protein